jgi:GH24 family phage-related lysozyme (muramidase)
MAHDAPEHHRERHRRRKAGGHQPPGVRPRRAIPSGAASRLCGRRSLQRHVRVDDAAYPEHAVEHLVTVPLTQGQYSALVSFLYNEGAGRLQTSTLLKDVNAKEYGVVPDQLAH